MPTPSIETAARREYRAHRFRWLEPERRGSPSQVTAASAATRARIAGIANTNPDTTNRDAGQARRHPGRLSDLPIPFAGYVRKRPCVKHSFGGWPAKFPELPIQSCGSLSTRAAGNPGHVLRSIAECPNARRVGHSTPDPPESSGICVTYPRFAETMQQRPCVGCHERRPAARLRAPPKRK